MRLSIVAAMCAGLSASAALASTGFLCELKNTGGTQGGFIRSPVVVVLNDTGTAGSVFDAVTLSVLEKPATARVRKTSRGELRVTWRVNRIPVVGAGSTSANYSARINPKTRAFDIRVSIADAQNDERGRGSCRKLTEQDANRVFRR